MVRPSRQLSAVWLLPCKKKSCYRGTCSACLIWQKFMLDVSNWNWTCNISLATKMCKPHTPNLTKSDLGYMKFQRWGLKTVCFNLSVKYIIFFPFLQSKSLITAILKKSKKWCGIPPNHSYHKPAGCIFWPVWILMFNMLACNRSLWAKISSIKRQSGAGGVGIALCTNSALSIQDLQGDNGSFLSRSPRLYQPELWQFNLFSVFQHELWMNPATSECGGYLRWSSSLLLRNSSFLCQRLGVDLKEVREREKKSR